MSDIAIGGEAPRSFPARFQPPISFNASNTAPLSKEVEMATRTKSDGVTWPQFGIICGLFVVFLSALGVMFSDNMKDVKHAVEHNTSEVTTVRERIVEISIKLDALIAETRQNRPR
jgi:hypothetical protein